MHNRSINFAVLVLVVVAVSLVAAVERAFAFGFAPHTDFATGTYPISVAVADFNADGKPDLATANYTASTVSVLLGDGAGGFAAKTDFATGANPYGIADGDFDLDGKPDLVTANWSGTVSVLLGNGSGGFAANADFAAGGNPASVAVGDFNADGKSDLAVANNRSSSVSVLLGNGAGSFTAKTDFTTGSGPYSVAVGDFNADGESDLAVANYASDTVSVLLGNGAGGFAAKTDSSTGTDPYSVAAADFNGDGKLDLVTDNIYDSTVSVLLGNGSGGFAAKTDFATGVSPYGLVVGDLNGDAKLDLATASTSAFTVSVLLGNGAGGFAAKTDFASGANPYGMAAGDFSGDGKLDLVTANTGTNTVGVLLSTPRGTMTIAGGATYTTSGQVTIDDAVYGVTEMRFRNEVGSWSSWEAYSTTKSWSLTSGDGAKTVYAEYREVPSDTLARSDTIILDATAPRGSFTIDSGGGYTNTRAITLHPTASDVHGPVEMQVRNAGAAWPAGWQALAVDVAWTLGASEGDKIVEMRFRDAAGNITEVVQTVVLDATPPGGWINVADGAYAVNTHSVDVDTWTIDLNGGVVMRLHGGGEAWPIEWTAAGGSVPITLPSGEGTKIVQAQFKDLAGNITLVQDEVIVDTIDPEGSLSIAGGDLYTSDTDVVLALAASDATKVDAFKVSQDGGEWSAWQDMVEAQPLTLTGTDGERTLEVQYRDIAGNTSTVVSGSIVLDRVAPATADNAGSVWHAAPFDVVLSPTDAASGMSGGLAKTEYSRDGGETWVTGDEVTYRAWKRGGGSGVHALLYRSTDAAGNLEEPQGCEVLIDARPPRTSDDAPLEPQLGDVTVHLTARDTFFGVTACSGVRETWYRIDDGGWQKGTAVPVSGSGLHWIAYYSVDNVGNAEYVRWCSVTIAAAGPVKRVVRPRTRR